MENQFPQSQKTCDINTALYEETKKLFAEIRVLLLSPQVDLEFKKALMEHFPNLLAQGNCND